MPFELRPPTGARTPSPDSSRTPAPRANGNRFFKDLAERRAAHVRAMDDARQGAQNAYNKTDPEPTYDTPELATVPRPSRSSFQISKPENLGFSSRLGKDFDRRLDELEAKNTWDAKREENHQIAKKHRQVVIADESNRIADAAERQFRNKMIARHGYEVTPETRNRLRDDADQPSINPFDGGFHDFSVPQEARSINSKEERRQILAELDALSRRSRNSDLEELDSDLLEDDDAPILTRGEDVYLPQEDVTDLPRRPLAEKSTARRTDIPQPFKPLSRADIQARQMTETVANLRAHQAAAQESANAFKGQLSYVTEATQTLADDFEKRFGVNLDALQHGGASLLQELKVGAFNIGASLGKLFGKKAESPQSFIDEYKKKTALLSDLTAEQRKYMDDARRLQRQIDEIVDPEGERLRRERAAVNAHFRGLGSGRGIAPHEGSVLDTVAPPRTIPQREQLAEEDPMLISSLDAEMGTSRSVSRPETAPSREPKRAEPEDQLDVAIREFRQRSSSAERSPESIETRTILNKLQNTRSELATLLLNADPNSPAWMQRVADMKRTMRELARTLHPDANPSVTPEITRLLSKIHTVFKDLEKLAAGTTDAETTVLGIVRALNAYDQEADQYTRTLNPNTRQGINQPKEHFVNAALLEYQASGTSIPLPIQKHGKTLRGTIARVYPTTVAVQWRDPDTGKTERLEVDKTALLAAPFQR